MIVNRAEVPQIATLTGEGDVAPMVTGKLAGREGGVLLLRVPVTPERSTGLNAPDIAQVVQVPEAAVLAMELGRIDPVRSGLLVGGVAAGATWVLLSIMDAFGRDPGDGGTGVIFFDWLAIPIG
jgi:hypothetical protein